MGEVTLLANVNATQSMNSSCPGKTKENVNQEGLSAFAMLFEGLTLVGQDQQLINIETIEAPEEEQDTLIMDMLNILKSSEEPINDLLSWFNGLSNANQQNLYQLFGELVDSEGKLKLPGQSMNQLGNEQKTLFTNYSKELASFINLLDTNNKQFSTKKADIGTSNTNSKNHSLTNQVTEGENQRSNQKNIPQTTQPINMNTNQFSNGSTNQGDIVVQSNISQTTKPINVNINQVTAEGSITQFNGESSINQGDTDVQDIDLAKIQYQHVNSLKEFKVAEVNTQNKQPVMENLNVKENFSSDLGKILIKNLKLPNGTTETKIQLHPQELGQIDVKLVANNGQISAQIFTETVLGRELLESQIHQLKNSLVSQGFQVDRIEVQQAPSASTTSNSNQDVKNGFNFSGQHSQKQNSKEQSAPRYSLNYTEEIDDFNFQLLNVSGIDYTV